MGGNVGAGGGAGESDDDGDEASSPLDAAGSPGRLASGGADEAREHPDAATIPSVSSARPASKAAQLRPNRSTSPSQPRAR